MKKKRSKLSNPVRSVSPVPQTQQQSTPTQTTPPSPVPQTPAPQEDDQEMLARQHEFFHPYSQRRRVAENRLNEIDELEDNEVEETIGRAGNRMTRMFSCDLERVSLGIENKEVSNAYNPKKVHKRGKHAKTIRQQRDKTSRETIVGLFNATASAIDTTFCDLMDIPRVRIALMVLNDLNDTPARGGNVAEDDIAAEKKDFYLLCHTARDLKFLMKAFKACCAERGRIGEGYNFIPFSANDEGYLQPEVDKYTENLKAKRARPAHTPRAYTDTLNKTSNL